MTRTVKKRVMVVKKAEEERLKRKRAKKLLKRKRAKKQKLSEKHENISKHSYKAHELRPSRNVERKNPNFKAFHNEGDLHSDISSQGHHLNSQNLSHELLDDALCKDDNPSVTDGKKVKMGKGEVLDGTVVHEITEFPKKSIGNDTKPKKVKKKRDRWGNILSNVGNMEDDMLENDEIASNEHMNRVSETNHGICEGEYDNKTVCAGGMPYDTTEDDIQELFKKCGAISNLICLKFTDTQRFKGLAFITFKTEAAATKALSLDGVNMGGRHIKIEKAKADRKMLRAPPKRELGSLSVYIGNLNWDIKVIDIKRFFKGCAIDAVRLAVDRQTGNFRGYGHVDFSDEKSLERAIKMNQKQLLGRPVKVSYAVSKGSKGSVSGLE